MSKKEKQAEKFIISLRENGLHSLWRGIESYGKYDKTQDNLMLKDAIMFLHHGVELLMKEVLINHSPFLIFENLSDAANKQKQADISGTGVFFLDKPPKTVTYEEAIKRVSAFVKPPELTTELQTELSNLNQLRNQLEHYAIEADKEKIIRLLAVLHEPLLELFDSQIGNIRDHEPAKVSQVWNQVQTSARFYSELEKEVFDLMTRFQGQKVPGHLLGTEGEFSLPIFTDVLSNHRVKVQGVHAEIDVLGQGEGFLWVVEVKGTQRIHQVVIDHVVRLSHELKAQPWLIVFADLPKRIREAAQASGVLITGAKEWQELKRIIHAEENS